MERDWSLKKTREEKILFAGFSSISQIDKWENSNKKNKLKNMIKKAKLYHNPTPEYGDNGYRFTDYSIEKVGCSIIVYPIEWMADFIGIEMKNTFDNNYEKLPNLSNILKSPELYYSFVYMTPHLIGFFAYTILNTNNEEDFNTALCILDLYRDFYLALMMNDKLEIELMVEKHKKWIESLN